MQGGDYYCPLYLTHWVQGSIHKIRPPPPLPVLTYPLPPLCSYISRCSQGTIRLAAFDSSEYFVYFVPFMFFHFLCMRLSYRGVPKMYLRRSLEESVFMLFCYARAFLTVVLGLKVCVFLWSTVKH